MNSAPYGMAKRLHFWIIAVAIPPIQTAHVSYRYCIAFWRYVSLKYAYSTMWEVPFLANPVADVLRCCMRLCLGGSQMYTCTALHPPPQATDYRGTTPLLSAFRSAHVELVDWLLGHVTHLPSDIECQRALVAPMPPDTDLLPRRSKSFEMIMKVCGGVCVRL